MRPEMPRLWPKHPRVSLTTSPHWQFPEDWSPDGRFLLVYQQAGAGNPDLFVLPLKEGAKARPYIATEFPEGASLFSPGGRWVTTDSNESDRYEVYVRSFPDPGRKWTVSRGGGWEPYWSSDGRELFFLDDKRMMVAAVRTEPTFRAEPPRLLFESQDPIPSEDPNQALDIAPDGQRFVALLDDAEESEPDQIVVIPDFAEELKAKMAQAPQ